MINIKQEIQVILLRQGLSMTKMLKNMEKEGVLSLNVASLSRMLATKSIKFETVQQILDYLGYEISVKQK